MTTGFKTNNLNLSYLDLITQFPPRKITNEAELIATQNQVNRILAQEIITTDERAYLQLLGDTIYEYEEKYEPIPKLNGGEILQALLEESNLEAHDLVPIFENETIIIDIIQGIREINEYQKQSLARFFRISPKCL